MHTDYTLKVKRFIPFANEVNITQIKANIDDYGAVTLRWTQKVVLCMCAGTEHNEDAQEHISGYQQHYY